MKTSDNVRIVRAIGRYLLNDGVSGETAFQCISKAFGVGDSFLLGHNCFVLVNSDTPIEGGRLEIVGHEGSRTPALLTAWRNTAAERLVAFRMLHPADDEHPDEHTEYKWDIKELLERGRKSTVIDMTIEWKRKNAKTKDVQSLLKLQLDHFGTALRLGGHVGEIRTEVD